MIIQPEIKVVRDINDLSRETAERIVEASRSAIAASGRFSIALSGGSTPKSVHLLLSSEPYKSQIDWSKVQIYWGDERCVPPDSPQSNYRMARETLLDHVPVPQANIHRMRCEAEPAIAADEYDRLLATDFPTGGIDLTLLGMGDDGHTASLFPETDGLSEMKRNCLANWVEKLNTWRVTMSYTFLNRSWAVLILASGKNKAARVSEVLEGPRDPRRLPIQGIAPESGKLTWIIDADAAGMNE